MAEHAEWYVKTDDGNVYGPADLPTLQKWAREGRVEPTSFTSADRMKWTPAPLMSAGVDARKLAALEMAARQEMERARKRGMDISLFGSKKK